jgi:hypothetical protein
MCYRRGVEQEKHSIHWDYDPERWKSQIERQKVKAICCTSDRQGEQNIEAGQSAHSLPAVPALYYTMESLKVKKSTASYH